MPLIWSVCKTEPATGTLTAELASPHGKISPQSCPVQQNKGPSNQAPFHCSALLTWVIRRGEPCGCAASGSHRWCRLSGCCYWPAPSCTGGKLSNGARKARSTAKNLPLLPTPKTASHRIPFPYCADPSRLAKSVQHLGLLMHRREGQTLKRQDHAYPCSQVRPNKQHKGLIIVLGESSARTAACHASIDGKSSPTDQRQAYFSPGHGKMELPG